VIHPDVAARFPLLDGLASMREAYGTAEGRQRIRTYESWEPEEAPPVVEVRDDVAPGPHGPVPVRIYEPPAGPRTGRPCLVWMHGGAFLGGDLDMREADWTAREVCSRAGAVVVSVDYRLCVGGVTYPVPHDDVVAAVRWVRESAAALGIDGRGICVGGASAGGNLAAGAALRLRDDDGWVPAALALAYTTTHPVLPPPSPSLRDRMDDVPRLLRFLPEDRAHITRNYLGGPESSADGYGMPALAVLDDLCPVLLLNAEYDDVRSSGEAFAAALALAGVDVRQVTLRGLLHGFLNQPAELEPVGRALDLIAATVRSPR
jgi:acetyl esterase/lipase